DHALRGAPRDRRHDGEPRRLLRAQSQQRLAHAAGSAVDQQAEGCVHARRLSGDHAVPEALDAIEEGAGPGRMTAGALADEGRLELLQQLALLGAEVDRGLDHRLAVQVARRAAAHRLDALVAQAEQLAGLGLGGNAQFHLAVQRRHADDVAQRRLRDADGHLAMEVVAIAHEDLVRSHPHLDVQVARRGTGRAGLAFAGEADAVAVVHAGRDLHRQRLLLLHPAIAVARRTGIGDHLPASPVVGARLLHGDDAALLAHLLASVACAAGLDLAVGRTRAVAGRTRRRARHVDALVDAGHGLFQVELHHVADVRASARP